jgi:hypothetical protein
MAAGDAGDDDDMEAERGMLRRLLAWIGLGGAAVTDVSDALPGGKASDASEESVAERSDDDAE